MSSQPSGIVAGQAWPVLRIYGAAASKFLQRMLSNDVNKINERQAAPAFLLEPTGRIVAGAWFVREGGDYLALCPPGWREALKAGLEKYRLADAVDFASDERAALVWLNPPAALHAQDFGAVVRRGEGLAIASGDYGGQAILWLGPVAAAPAVAAVDAESLRLASATPAFDHELTRETIPLEAGLYGWLSNRKGCYVGQEVIERMWSRDRIARRLTRFWGQGSAAQTLPIKVGGEGGKGVITSLATAADGALLGLGYYSGAVAALVRDDAGGQWRAEPVEMRATP